MLPVRANTPLRQALAADGRRQSWLAERLNVDPRQVWGWVHGIHVPQADTQHAIADILGHPVEELFPADAEAHAA